MAQLGPIINLRKRTENVLDKKHSGEDLYSKLEKEESTEEVTLSPVELKLQNDELSKCQQSLIKAQHHYNTLFDLTPLSYFLLNQRGQIINVNQSGAALLSIAKSSLLNRFFHHYIAPESQEMFSTFCQQTLHETKDHSCVLRLLNRNGPLFYAKLESKKQLGDGTEAKQLFLVVTDITHLIKTEKEIYENEQQLVHFEQATPINTLAVTITQQLNRPLAVMSNFIHGCMNRIKTNNYLIKDILSALEQSTKQLQYISDIILRLKNFSYKIDCLEEVCLNTLINDTLELIQHECAAFLVSIRYLPIPGSVTLKIDKIHIQQVLIHLIRNAIESMQDDHTSEPRLIIEGMQISKEFIEVSITDNGPGFSPDISHRLFDPQFTTKSYATGMGLAISRNIIENHGGTLTTSLDWKTGACFKFTLCL